MIAGSLVELCFEWSSVLTNEWTTCGVTWRHKSEAQKTLTVVAGHQVYQYLTCALRNHHPPKMGLHDLREPPFQVGKARFPELSRSITPLIKYPMLKILSKCEKCPVYGWIMKMKIKREQQKLQEIFPLCQVKILTVVSVSFFYWSWES